MSTKSDSDPTKDEIEKQLECMLASKRFRAARNQADFLDFVVRRKLEGKKSTEEIIGRALFGPKFKRDESTDVRVTASNLRKTLKNYYGSEGCDDLVVIALPEPPSDRRIKLRAGEAYQPSSSYNPKHADMRKLRLASHYLSQRSLISIEEALGYLQNLESQRGDSLALIVETICTFFLYEKNYEPLRWHKSAHQIATTTVTRFPESWRSHAVRGVAWLFDYEIDKAGQAFAAAMVRNKVETLNYSWYRMYLFTIGNTDEAVQLARAQSAEQFDSAMASAEFGIYLYLTRRFDEAENALNNALRLDRNLWITHLVLVVVHLALDRVDEAFQHYERLQILSGVEKGPWVMPGIGALCAYRAKDLDEQKRQWTKHWAATLMDIEPGPDPFQAVLFSMALNEIPEAIDYLETARNAHHPLALWLDSWPILDPLRQHPKFQSLAAERSLPPSKHSAEPS